MKTIIVVVFMSLLCFGVSCKKKSVIRDENKAACDNDCMKVFSSETVSSHVSTNENDAECWCIVQGSGKGIRIW
jgi:hypothetical protein